MPAEHAEMMRMRRFGPAIWTWYWLSLTSFLMSAFASGAANPAYVLDLTAAPWSNIGLAAIAAQLGGLWGFLRKLTKDEIPRDRVFLHFAMDMLGSVILGAGCLFIAERAEMTVGNTLLMILGAGLAGSWMLEAWMKFGPGLGKTKM